MTIRLSIIVPVYRVEAYVERCIRSLLDQDLDPADLEIVVIDDGSPDGSMDIVRRVLVDRPSVTILTQTNQGLSAARNHGLKVAKGQRVLFVDSDDTIAPRVLGTLLDTMERQDLQLLAFGLRTVREGDPEPVAAVPPPDPGPVQVTSGIRYLEDHVYLNNVWWYLIDRRFLLDSGIEFEAGRFVEDALFTARLFTSAARVGEVPITVYQYLLRTGSIMRTHGDAHTRKLARDYERVATGLAELMAERVADGTATDGWMARIGYRQQAFVFFLIGRLIRSAVPLRPELMDVLDRLRDVGAYPFDRFPGAEHRGLEYRVLAPIFARPWLLLPFARSYRAYRSTRGRLRRGHRGA